MIWNILMGLAFVGALAVVFLGWRKARAEAREAWQEFDAMRELAEAREALTAQFEKQLADVNGLAHTLQEENLQLQEELNQLKALPEVKPEVPSLLVANPLSQDEKRRILAGTQPDTPWWKFIHQVLATETETAMDRVSDARMAERPGSMAHAAGALEMLLALRNNLEADRVDAHRIQDRENRRAA